MALKGQPSQGGDGGRVAEAGLSEAERRLLRKLTRPPDSRRTKSERRNRS